MPRRALLLLTLTLLPAGAQTRWREHAITSGLKMGYQLVLADLNHDGKLDVIPVDERATELAWYENPGWQRHVLIAGTPRIINLECYDYDGDGTPEIAMAHHFETAPERSVGNVLVLKAGADPRAPWQAREIDRVPTAHRLRWIDWRGDGRKALLVAPLVGAKAKAPDYAGDVPVYLYRPGEWRRETLITGGRGVLHSIHPFAWAGKRGEQLLTADFLGLRVWAPARGGAWTPRVLAAGDPRACPLCGSSEIKVGRAGKRRFLAAIEPWHGNQVVVYTQAGKTWQRHGIDESFVNGHALAVADVDGDGIDEIVAGFRGKGFNLYLYKAADKQATRWTRSVLDAGGVAAADCKIADMTGDGRPDIVCAGASTANVKLYENLGR